MVNWTYPLPHQNWPFHTHWAILHFRVGFLLEVVAQKIRLLQVSRVLENELLDLLFRTWGYDPRFKGKQALFLSQHSLGPLCLSQHFTPDTERC